MTTNREQESSAETVSPPSASATPGPGPTGASPGTDSATDKDGTIQAECERLRHRVQQLEAECGGYHRALTALLRERCAQADTSSDADLDRLAEEALRLGDFDEELLQLLHER